MMGTHLYRKDITLQIHRRNRHTRTRGDMILPEGTNLNQELVKHGWLAVPEICSAVTVLQGLETGAREERRGL